MGRFFAALDCGTSTIKVAIFSERGKPKAIVRRPYPLEIKGNCAIEQSPQLLLQNIYACLREAVKRSKVKPASLLSFSLSTQRATVLSLGKDKKILTNFISWQDLRGKEALGDFRKEIPDKDYYKITGLPNNPVFSLAKILWIKKNQPALYKKTKKFLLLHSYILNELGCKDYREDYSNASLTGLFDIRKFNWSTRILRAAGLEKNKLAGLVSSGKVIGFLSKGAAKRTGLIQGMPLVSGGGDHQCAGLGAGAAAPGILEITLGTTGVPLAYSHKPVFDPKMRVMCCAHVVDGRWELEGLQASAGASIQWLGKMIAGKDFSLADFRKAKKSGVGARGILFYPYLLGASCPNWNPEAKGVFLGLTPSSKKADLLRAAIEGVSFETKEIIDLFLWLGVKVKKIRLAGGFSNNSPWNQIQADIFQKKISTLRNRQATLSGAAALAAFGLSSKKPLRKTALRFSQTDKFFYPDKKKKTAYNKIYRKYKNIYRVLAENKIFKN